MWMKNSIATLITLCIGVQHVHCILSKSTHIRKTTGKGEDIKKQDNVALPSLEREYGYNENHIGGYGSTGLGGYGNYDGYNSYETSKYHGYEEHKHHEHHDSGYHKALAIKGLLVPLAGVALLGAAAAFVSNPILLQLGVVSGTYGARTLLGRRRRDTNNYPALEMEESAARLEAQARLNEIHLLERFMAQVPKEEMQSQEKKLLANYLSCSGMTAENACLERLTCELHTREAASMPVETNVMAIVTGEILSNDFIPDNTKVRISRAEKLGKENGDCQVYICEELEKLTEKGK